MTVFNLASQFTMIELAKMMANGNVVDVINVLATSRHFYEDAVWIQANQTASHVGSRVTNEPTSSLRQANQGVAATTGTSRQVSEPICRRESRNEIDEAILDLVPAGQKNEVRTQKDKLHVSSMTKDVESDFFYQDIDTTPEGIDGLSIRYDALSDDYVYGCGGTGDDTTSLWIVEWGPDAVYMTYPQGSQIGIQMNDKGLERVTDSGGTNEYYAWVTQFVFWYGLFVSDDRCVQRIANIETAGAENTLDDDLIIEALNQGRINENEASKRIYVNRTLKTQLDIMAKDKANVNYSPMNAFGENVVGFRGVPIRLAEQLVNTETAIT